jgi:hypothetical protein
MHVFYLLYQYRRLDMKYLLQIRFNACLNTLRKPVWVQDKAFEFIINNVTFFFCSEVCSTVQLVGKKFLATLYFSRD